MSKIYKGYEAGKQIFGALKKAFTGGKQKTTGTEVISSVNIGKNLTKKKTIKDDLIKSRDKHLAGVRDEAKVEIKSKNPLSKFTKKIEKIVDEKATGGRVGKMGGGMMSRRMGYQDGSKKGKVPTTPKEKAFGMLSVNKGLDNNKNITFTDKIAGATGGKKKKKA